MSIREYTIKAFRGINQSKIENALDAGETADARNFDTAEGALAVAKGYVKHIPYAVPGTGDMRRLYVWRDLVSIRYIVVAGREVYAYTDTAAEPAWKLIHTYAEDTGTGYPPFTGLRWDFLETRIGDTDYIIIANGEGQLIKWDGLKDTAELFGAKAKQSDKPVNYIEMHYNRFFAAGDRDYPSRLYWSKPPGDSRSIEDWSVESASENASGGHVDVGDTSKDPITGLASLSNQLIIFKRGSIYRLLGDRPSNYRVTRLFAEVEPMTNTSLIIYGDTPFWMTAAGMFYHDGQNTRPHFSARYIRRFLEGARLSMCKAATNRDKLYFTCAAGDKDGYLDDAVIEYDVIENEYMVRDGFSVADICGAGGTLYMINGERIIYRFGEGEDYDGAPIRAYWNTPATDLDNKPGVKALREVFLRGQGSSAEEGTPVILDIRVGGNVRNYRHLMPANMTDVLEIPVKNEGRTFSMRIANEAGKRFRIEGGLQVLYELRQRTR